jgi:DNA-binding GntR family transcriptional regulator
MTASERAYEYTKERILDGRFKGGELISEGDVATPTGLSRTPVREAFLRLESEGLLRLFPKRGALVVPVSAGEVEAVMETRLVVEQFAIAKTIATEVAPVPSLEAAIELQHELVAARDNAGFVEADREFHRLFVASAANPILLEVHDSLRDRQTRMGLAAIALDQGREDSIMREHRELVDAIRDGDPVSARGILERHLGGTLTALQRGFGTTALDA